MDISRLHLHWAARKKAGKEYRVYSLARSIRTGSKVRKQIIYKLGTLSDREVKDWRQLLNDAKCSHESESPKSNTMTAKNHRFDYSDSDNLRDIELYKKMAQQAFVELPDPREQNNLRYPFYEMLLIILAATLASAKSIKGIYEYAQEKSSIFTSLLGIDQVPGYMAFWWIITRTNSNMLNQVFTRWITEIADELTLQSLKQIAIDGKTLRGAKKKSVHYVSAYDNTRGLLLGQVKTAEKSNEITAVPELLKIIDIRNAVVTIDAMGCQRQIVCDIREREGHYVIALKGNQETLHSEAQNFFLQARNIGYVGVKCSRATATNKGHGREEVREVVVIEDLEWLDCKSDWQDLKALIEVKSTRTLKDKTTTEYRYYITSKKMNAKRAGGIIRSHWGIENKLHWVLDVLFHDDESQANTGHSAENLGLFRRIAYCLLKQDTIKGRGLASKQRKAMWNEQYVLELLSRFINQTKANA